MSSLNNKISINDEINSKMDSEERPKILLNTNVLFLNKKDGRTKSINNQINHVNINNNQKQVFKKINLKIASRLITNNLLKIKPNIKVDVNNVTIKLIRSSLKNKEKTFIPNPDSSVKKYISTIPEPIKVNKKNKIKNNNRRKSSNNPFKTINQPIDPMTLEMEKFKKMRMIEHKNSFEKKRNQKKAITSAKKISKNKTNFNYMNLIKNHIFDTQSNKPEDKTFKENNIIYQSYKENVNKRKKDTNKIRIDKINNTNSDLNSLELKPDSDNNNYINGIPNPMNDFNSLSLRNSGFINTKEKQNSKKASTVITNSQLSSSSNTCAKETITKNKKNTQNNIKLNKYSSFTQKNKKKIEKKKIEINSKMIETYKSIPHRKPLIKKNNKANYSLNNIVRNREKTLNKEKNVNKTQNNINVSVKHAMLEKNKKEVCKDNIEKLVKLLLNYNKINLGFFFNQIKKIIIIQNAKKSKESEKVEIMNMKLNKKEKEEKIKKFFDTINTFYNNEIIITKKSILNKLKNFVNNNKKLESAKNLIVFFKNHNKLIIIDVYNRIKSFIKDKKKFDAMKKIYNCLTKCIFYKKYISFYEFKLYFIKCKQKNYLVILDKIISRNIIDTKKYIIHKMLLYYNNKKKLEKQNIIRDLIIKAHESKKKKYIFCFINIFNYKIKVKSIKDLIEIISIKILSDKKFSFNRIKEYMIGKRKIEGIDRFNNIFIEMRLKKLRINFKEFINNIIKLKIKTAYEKLDGIFLLKKSKIKNVVFFKLKKDYENKINIIKLFLILESINTRLTNQNKKYLFQYIKYNYKNKSKNALKNTRKSHENIKINNIEIEDKNSLIIEKKSTGRRWENNKIDNINMYSIQIDSRNRMANMKKNILREESMSFTLSKKNAINLINIKNQNEEDSESDNEIWTTTVEKWGVKYNVDDSLYQKCNED